MAFERRDAWDVDGITAVFLVPFVAERLLLLRAAGGHVPLSGMVRAGEHWCVTATRLLRETAGASLDQDAPAPLVHPFGIVREGRHAVAAAWCDVVIGAEPVGGVVLVHPDEASRTLSADAADLVQLAAGLRRAGVDDSTWSRDVVRLLEEHYLRAATPEGQSGKGGGAAGWELARRLVVGPVHHDGTFLDLGCANGLLMESVRRWAAEDGRRLEPYGLDASERLVALARRRLPRWRDRFFVGDALTWTPPRRFDFVHTMPDLVPPHRRPDWLRRVLDDMVAPGGRLIVRAHLGVGDRLRSWGLPVAGSTVQPRGDRPPEEAVWFDAPG